MPLFKKKGGGFLNGVSGTLDYIKFDSKEWGEGDDAYTSLSVELGITQDGADDAVKQFLGAGFIYDGMTISDDGSAIEGGDDGPVVGEDSEFARFVQSAIESGFPESDLDESGRDFSALAGKRYTYGKEPNVERQMAAGKKKLGKKAAGATQEDIMLAGRRQDANDKKKFYNHDRLIVTAVLGEVELKPANGKKGAKTAPKADAKPAKTSKESKKGKDVEEVDYETADALLIELLAVAKDNTINKASLTSLIVRKYLEDDGDEDERDAYRKLLSSDEFLKREEGWTFDKDDKKQPVTLAKKKKK